MKALFFTLTLMTFSLSHSQKYDCASKTREYQEFLKTQDFNGSYQTWLEVSKNVRKKVKSFTLTV